MGDRDKVACGQDHELAYILRKYGKSGAKANVEKFREVCKKFKVTNKDVCRTNFYKYLKDNKILAKFK